MKPWFKRNLKRVLFGLFGGALLIGSLGACSHRGDHGWNMSEEKSAEFRSRIIERVGKELDLNEQQKRQLGALTDKLREQRAALVGKTTDPRAELQSLIAGPQFDKAKAQVLIDEKTNALRGKSPEVLGAAAEFFDGLNPQQQQKVRDVLQNRGRWFHRG